MSERIRTRVDHIEAVDRYSDVWSVAVFYGAGIPAEIGADFATEDRARNAASIIERLANDDMGPLVFPLSIHNPHGGPRYEVEVSLRIDGGECADYPTLRISSQNCNLVGVTPGEYVLTPLRPGGES